MGWLLLAWAALHALPFRWVARGLRPRIAAPRPPTPSHISRVHWIVDAVADRVPWRAVCFHRGIAAQRILAGWRIAADLHYGVTRQAPQGLQAHVWVTAGDIPVIGCEELEKYTHLTTFAAK